MTSVKKPAWQQATALVSLSTCGAMTGLTFARGTVADVTSPTSMPAHLLALDEPAASASPKDSALRSAIVGVANHYLQLAQTRTPAQMEALIWQVDSVNGADHGPSCAAFASLTLALGANAVGQQSWATGGSSYPWPLHQWADVRVQPNPASPDVVSLLQDAQAHHRWHPLGDGYRPQPGDWVLFDGHVEVATRYTGAVLSTVGADSLPNLTVNAHEFTAPLAAQGVLGFVNNGELTSTVGHNHPSAATGSQAGENAAQVPGVVPQPVAAAVQDASGQGGTGRAGPAATAAVPGVLAGTSGGSSAGPHPPRYLRHDQQPTGVPGTAAQQAFISLVAPGAIVAEERYGIPAAVTIAQAIDESGWGQSELATADHNLFGIKGAGPAGSDMRPTQEYENGVWVTSTAPFRVYHNIAESIEDHSQLLATGAAYRHAMANRRLPDAFANALTGVYATDPDYGSNLIALMRLYHLYRYDSGTSAGSRVAPLEPQVTGRQAAVPGASGVPGVAGALAVGTMRRRRTPEPGPRAQPGPPRPGPRAVPRGAPRAAPVSTRRYVAQIPYAVSADFVATAKGPLIRWRPLYQDVASRAGIPWELLAACDWMQCQARPRYSPVHGEKLGTVNPDGTVFRTKSAALAQCAGDLIELADAVYLIGLTGRRALSVRELANAFAAFRWGGLLRAHHISAMEFPYSVAGLTAQHLKMRWPDIDDPYTPDKPGMRFRMPFGALPVVLSLGYKAAA
jgi:flagellum-specific peptidoglycan hydrolase FlgJ